MVTILFGYKRATKDKCIIGVYATYESAASALETFMDEDKRTGRREWYGFSIETWEVNR